MAGLRPATARGMCLGQPSPGSKWVYSGTNWGHTGSIWGHSKSKWVHSASNCEHMRSMFGQGESKWFHIVADKDLDLLSPTDGKKSSEFYNSFKFFK